MSRQTIIAQATICWNCANATGGCSWADKLIPVKGWKAEKTQRDNGDSYRVFECPLFVQDAANFGLYRMPKEDVE